VEGKEWTGEGERGARGGVGPERGGEERGGKREWLAPLKWRSGYAPGLG